jgi:8-oxo-dGTP pyrophosphatase MutT (NUDIX family)
MQSPFDPPDMDKPKLTKPRDAATLVLVRGGREVMMGQRGKGHVFMPDKWVFPGGRVDPGDARLPAAAELTAETEWLLQQGGVVRRPPRAFALAAARETLEETGLQVGGPEGPDLSRFSLVARAVTPPYRPRRYDARFFMADADAVLFDDRPAGDTDELLQVRWLSFAEAEQQDLPRITRYVLGEVQARLAGQEGKPPFFRWRRGGHVMERLG